LISSALPSLEFAPDEENMPLDLTDAFIRSLEFLMLAQAQECVWQKAVMGKIYPWCMFIGTYTTTQIVSRTD